MSINTSPEFLSVQLMAVFSPVIVSDSWCSNSTLPVSCSWEMLISMSTWAISVTCSAIWSNDRLSQFKPFILGSQSIVKFHHIDSVAFISSPSPLDSEKGESSLLVSKVHMRTHRVPTKSIVVILGNKKSYDEHEPSCGILTDIQAVLDHYDIRRYLHLEFWNKWKHIIAIVNESVSD